jgi:dipeptidyl-peptidase 4
MARAMKLLPPSSPSPSFVVPAAAAFALLLAASGAAQDTQRLTFEESQRPQAWQTSLPEYSWAAGTAVLAVREAGKTSWIDARSGEPAAAPAEAAAAAEPVLLLHENDLWLDHAAPPRGRRERGEPAARPKPSAKAVRLTSDGAVATQKQEAHLAPSGRFASFVVGNDLVIVDCKDGASWRVTTDGGADRFHGVLDWVYQEELYGRGDFQGHWWSPVGDRCAFLSLDESAVRDFTVVDHVPPGFLATERAVVSEVTKYPKAGDPNPTARLSVADPSSQRVVAVDLAGMPADVLVVRVGWTPDGARLLVTLQDRIQTWAELCSVDPATGARTRLIREESPTWVNRPEPPRFLPDGSFLWLSERTGYQHVYHHEADGRLRRAVTQGEWQVRAIERLDVERRVLWFEGTQHGATGRHLHRIALDGGEPVLLTPGVGTHDATLDAAGELVLDRWSALDQPTVVRVLDAATGEVVREVARAELGEAAKKYAFPMPRRLTIAARDGYELDAVVQLPPDWTEGRRYPVFLPTYSGPDAPTVRDRFAPSSFHVFLAQQGFVVLQVNVRSASGRGQVHTGTCYRQLGVQELKDLEDAVDHVVAHFGGDPGRVAISGWSYGGFMAAYALTHSDKFALGLAGAGVYDWQLYDTIYTERYMRTPQENADGYARTSVVKAAKDLRGQLVLIHGTMDDNVHLQNSMQLLWELQLAGKQDVELMLYPRSRHSLDRRVRGHSQEFQWRRLERLLGPRTAR